MNAKALVFPAALLLAGCCSHAKNDRVDRAPRTVAEKPAAPSSASVGARPVPGKTDTTEIAYARRERVTIEANDADLRDVIDQISRQAGVNIVVEPRINEKVTINLRDIYWLEAVQVIAQLTRCEVNVLRNGVYYVIEPPRVTISGCF